VPDGRPPPEVSDGSGEPAPAAAARVGKSASAFRTIGEVAEDLDLPAHVLRFWESKFPQLRPLKRGGGRRYYRPEDIVLLRRIRQCLYQDGYTIRGVQKLLADLSPGGMPPAGDPASPPSLFAAPTASTPSPLAEPSRDPAAADHPARDAALRDDAAALARRIELEAIRRDLLEARALLQQLLPPNESE
jgi:DNA-binding transcriptional MerR regulator